MPAAPTRNFAFICGQDDFLVGRMGRKRFDELSGEGADEFSREIVNGFAANVDDVEKAVNRFSEAVQTIPMFGGRRVIWLKDVNFLADTVMGKSETTLKRVEDLQAVLQSVNPAESAVLVTAAPVDRRRSFPKWCEKHAEFALADGGEGGEGLASVVQAEARATGVQFGPGAMELLLVKVGANTRLLVEEVHKLAAYAAEGSVIEEASVAELTPNVAQGDFFEMAEAFFSGDLKWTLAALRRHYFTGGDARPMLAALQNRNRILTQLRALVDAGEVKVGPRGVDGLAQAAQAHAERYGEAAGEKSSYNVFAQNPWYLGKLAGSGRLPSLRRLIDNQRAFVEAFGAIIDRPHEQEEVLRDMAVRCLAA
jgi:DNA polymerase-3 subunit delta